MKKKILTTCCFTLLSMYSTASESIQQTDSIDPPPDTPIDSFLPFVLFITIIIVGYYFNRRSNSFLDNK